VRVQSPCGPVEGAAVTWAGDGTIAPKSPTTDGDGVVEATWTLDAAKEAQAATATLTDLGANAGANASFHASSAVVQFTANLSVADHVGYVPGCNSLKTANVTTVDAALNELCKLLEEERRPAVRIRRVLRGDGEDLENDADITVGQWLADKVAPITVELAPGIDPKLVLGRTGKFPQNPRVIVTLEGPWPDKNGLIGFHPIFLAGQVQVPEGNKELRWTPIDATRKWLFSNLWETVDPQRVLIRLTLKGNFIGRGALVLDGEPFGPKSTVNDNEASGDDRPGGDFEIWFWLVRG
jgi:hypothetical protein